jgi:hypothetical protein
MNIEEHFEEGRMHIEIINTFYIHKVCQRRKPSQVCVHMRSKSN